jgi:hypothetical protein
MNGAPDLWLGRWDSRFVETADPSTSPSAHCVRSGSAQDDTLGCCRKRWLSGCVLRTHLSRFATKMGHPGSYLWIRSRGEWRNAGVSPLRFAPVEMTWILEGVALLRCCVKASSSRLGVVAEEGVGFEAGVGDFDLQGVELVWLVGGGAWDGDDVEG